jgi:hypothetical protein
MFKNYLIRVCFNIDKFLMCFGNNSATIHTELENTEGYSNFKIFVLPLF